MIDRGGHRNRISWEQRQDIVRVYLRDGLDAAQKIATDLGLSPKYVQKLLYQLGICALLLIIPFSVSARDPAGRFAGSPLHDWFMSLTNAKGSPCCADADGNVVADADWESRDGHYRVRIMDQWIDVPDEAVVIEPNRYGRTMVWPYYSSDYGGPLKVHVRCFMPGSMT